MRNRLPHRYRASHKLCMFLYQTMAGHLKDAEQAGLFKSVTIKFKNMKAAREFSNLDLEGEELWQWLDDNGYTAEMDVLAYLQSLAALVSDYCQYMYLALEASKGGNTAPAYTLLRKPLTDNLLHLEWLAADAGDYIRTLRRGGTKAIKAKLEGRENKLNIIKGAHKKIKANKEFGGDLLYEIRYEKSNHNGFAATWNQATHLITTHKHLQTEDHNINFIFSGNEERETQWDHIYLRLPLLLNYSVDLIEYLFSTLAEPDAEAIKILKLQRNAGIILWSNRSFKGKQKKIKFKEKIECPTCYNKLSLDEADLELLYEAGLTICPNCFNPLIGTVTESE